MSDIINILPDSVANQIAAGEVVDRPASAVKELLENALDAGASSIQLIVKDSGRTLFQVIDNGCGMSDCDARLCFERHATSKIHHADDLFAIRTMGFRGEALASIAAVAQVELRTRPHDSDLGTCVLIEGSDVKDQLPCNCAKGTSIAVKNLFYNIPARRNFLKKDSVELAHIDEIFRRIALVNPETNFSFYSNGKLLYDLHAGNMAQRIAGIFGNSYKERLFPVDENTDVVSVHGYVCKPEYVRRTRGEQYLFVNGRFIKHPAISTAIERAYTELIPEKTYPSYFICLNVDPARIDVNIHPAKTEIRFEDEHALFAIIRAATKRALGQFSLATEIEFNPSTEIEFSPAPKGYVPDEPKISYNPNYNPFNSTKPERPAKTTEHFMGEREHLKPSQPSQWETFFDAPNTEMRPNASSENNTHTLFADNDVSSEDNEPQPSDIQVQVINFQNRYIVSTLKSGLLIIDQHRAHERIIFERLMARIGGDSTAYSQQLLFPINCSFSPSDAELLNELLPELQHMGFAISSIGTTTFVITATPTDISDNDLQGFFEHLISDYKGEMLQKFTDRDKVICMSLARQMAVRQGQALHTEEMQNIIADLFSCQLPNISPSGKKTMVILNDLEDRFR